MTRAKRDILGMSEEEIRNDLEQQRMEKAASAEMEQTSTIIKKTGIFDRVDTLYGEFGTTPTNAAGGEGDDMGGDDMGGGDFGGGGGGAAFGGGDFGAEMEGGETAEAGAEAGAEIAAAETPVESTNKKGDLLVEENKSKLTNKTKKYQSIYLKRLIESIDNDQNIINVDNGVETINSKIDQMSKEIDSLIREEEK